MADDGYEHMAPDREAAHRHLDEALQRASRQFDDLDGPEVPSPRELNDLLARAEAGDARAQYEAGVCYYKGLCATVDDGLAAAWFERAAGQGHAGAHYALGLMLEAGYGGPAAEELALARFVRAGQAGLAKAWRRAGLLHLAGQDLPADEPAAYRCFDAALAAGGREEAFELGKLLHEKGYDHPATFAPARRYLALAEGNPQASLLLGWLYEDGKGGPVDVEAAEACYLAALDAGLTGAHGYLADLYTPLDRARALEHHRLAAEAAEPVPGVHTFWGLYQRFGDRLWTEEQWRLGLEADALDGKAEAANSYASTLEFEGDRDRAAHFYGLAAEAGDPAAMFKLGQFAREQGDDARALVWYERAATLLNDDDFGYAKLGQLYADVFHVAGGWEPEPPEATWEEPPGLDRLVLEAAGGDPTALYRLSEGYRQAGEMDEAARCQLLAAEAGQIEAQRELALRLVDEGRPLDAWRWAERAATAGDREAMLALASLAFHGEGALGPDDAAAVRWSRAAAAAGLHSGRYLLGILLALGRGVDADPVAAAACFLENVRSAHPGSALELGKALMAGKGIERDPARAFRCFRICYAACQEVEAARWLVRCYREGLGTAPDPEAAAQLQAGIDAYESEEGTP